MRLLKKPQERFSGLAEGYARHRPGYPGELFEWIAAAAGLPRGARVADIGCGTGISTRLWAEKGFDAVGIDPNDDMLAQAVRHGGAAYRKGSAEATGLAEASQDLVTAAQALHWVELDAAFSEFFRILKPGAFCAAFWNVRAATPLSAEYDALLLRYCVEYKDLGRGPETIAAVKAHPLTRQVAEKDFSTSQRFDRPGFFGRVYSSSYVAVGVRDRAAFDRGLDALFDKHQEGGTVEFRYRTAAVLWRLGRNP